MENYVGKICPFCKTEFKEEDTVKECPACGIPHHEACWEENKGCTTFGCSEQHYEAQGTNPTDVCKNCGTSLGDGQMFCPKCGTQKVEEKKPAVCAGCGTQLNENQAFCPACGRQANVVTPPPVVNPAINNFTPAAPTTVAPAKKKTKILPIIIAVVLVIAAIGGYFAYSTIQENKRLEAIAAYKAQAKEFCADVLDSGSTMEDIGNAIQSAWSKYVSSSKYGTYYNGTYIYSVDSAVAAAQDEQAANISAVKAAHSGIQSMYNSLLVLPDTEDQELQAIKEAVKDVYDAYQDMYDVVIEVSGNYTTYKSEFSSTDTALANAIDDLYSFFD